MCGATSPTHHHPTLSHPNAKGRVTAHSPPPPSPIQTRGAASPPTMSPPPPPPIQTRGAPSPPPPPPLPPPFRREGPRHRPLATTSSPPTVSPPPPSPIQTRGAA